jgi:hypothetical protein
MDGVIHWFFWFKNRLRDEGDDTLFNKIYLKGFSKL